MMKPALVAMFLVGVLGCGSDDESTPIDAATADTATVDAATVDAAHDAPTVIDAPLPVDATPVDAPASTVVVVQCPGQVASEVTAPGFSFVITDATIAVNDIVRFTMPGSHSAVSGATPGVFDGVFRVEFNQTVCLRFTAAGTFPFWCNPHQFTGSITVGP